MQVIEDKIIATRTEICLILGLTETRISQLVSQGTLQKISKGKYDLGECVKNYVAYIKAGSVESGDLEDEKLRKLTAEATLKELELEAKRGELVPVVDVQKSWGEIIQKVKQKLLFLPTKLAPEVVLLQDNNTAKAFLEEAIREVLVELSDPEQYKSN